MKLLPMSRLAVRLLAALGSLIALPAIVQAQSIAASYTFGARYDLQGRVTGTLAPDPDSGGPLHFAAVRNSYDASGNLWKIEKGELASWQSEMVAPASWAGFTILQTAEMTFDSLGRKLSERVKGSDGAVVSLTQYSYDEFGRIICAAVRMNPAIFASPPSSACSLGTQGTEGPDRITKNVYDAAGQLIQVRKAVGTNNPNLEQAYATYSYTPNGKQEYVIDANGNRAKLEYDGFDRQIKWIFPSAALPSGYSPSTQANALSTAGSLNAGDYEQYSYDENGNRTSLRKRDGSTLTYQYDALNRNTTKSVPERAGLGTTHTRDIHYSYNARGLMTGARFDSVGGEGITTDYDGFGRINFATQVLDSASQTLTYTYDRNGNRTSLMFPDSGVVNYSFDGLDRPQSVSTGTPAWSRTYSYGQRGTLTQDNVAAGAGSTTFGHDTVGRLSSLGRDIAGGASLDITTTLGYNPASQISLESRSNDAYAFTARANVNRPYTPNGLNQYTAAGSASFCHDANGNLTADGTSVYLYDVENRLVEKRAQTNTSCSSLAYTGALEVSLRYDPMGRLYETIGSATGITRFLIDGDAMVAEYNASGAILRRYIHGADGKTDDPVVWFEGSAMSSTSLRNLYANQQGSIVLMADSAGAAARLFRFDEYGIPQSGDGAALTPANGARFLYTGQAWLPDLGMYYYKARIYSPTLGRFMQTDPIGYEDDANLYAYVGNDPVNKGDPTGTTFEEYLALSTPNSYYAFGSSSGSNSAGARAPGVTSNNAAAQGGPKPSGSTRSAPPAPDPAAGGDPHTRIQTPGPDGRYTTYDEHGPKVQYRGEPNGRSHGEIPRPNVKEWSRNVTPDGRTFSGKPTVRAPHPGEIPAARAAPAPAAGAAGAAAAGIGGTLAAVGIALLLLFWPQPAY